MTARLRQFPRTARRGFSFTEVLFAVMILGVGFIMVAAIFPVAIQQARTTQEEGNAAAFARGAVSFIEKTVTSVDMPARGPIVPLGQAAQPGYVMSFRDAPSRGGPRQPVLNSEAQRGPTNNPPRWQTIDQLWNKVRGNLIVPDDTRYAWVPLYRRDWLPGGTPSPYAQVFIIVTQVRNDTPARSGTSYAASDVHTKNPGTELVNLQARPVLVTIDGALQQIRFESPGSPNLGAAAEGAYVIIADDNLQPPNTGRMNGRIYRVGNRLPDPNQSVWELMPGNDFVAEPRETSGLRRPAITGLTRANAFIVGRTLVDPTNRDPNAAFQGTAQDIAIYTTFIQVK